MTQYSPTSSAARSAAISACRCTAMVFILACHFLQYYSHELAWWLNVGVQMFLFLSGFLYGGKPIASAARFLGKNFKKILIPYYCYLLPVLLIYALLAPEHLSAASVLSALLCVGTVKGLEHLWFVGYILLCYLLTPVLSRLTEKWKQLSWGPFLALCMLTVVIGQVCALPFYSHFTFSRIACYMTGFYAAAFFRQYGSKLFRRIAWTVIVMGAAVNAFRIVVRYILPLEIPGFGLFEQYAHLLLGAALVLTFLLTMERLKENKLLLLSDRYSYCIYIVHHLFLLGPFTLLTVTAFPPLNWLLAILAICICSVVLNALSNRVLLLTTPKRS